MDCFSSKKRLPPQNSVDNPSFVNQSVELHTYFSTETGKQYFRFPTVIRSTSPKVIPMINIPWKLKTNKIIQEASHYQAHNENPSPLLSGEKSVKQDIQEAKTNSSMWKLLIKAQSILLTTQKQQIQLFPCFSILLAIFLLIHPPTHHF